MGKNYEISIANQFFNCYRNHNLSYYYLIVSRLLSCIDNIGIKTCRSFKGKMQTSHRGVQLRRTLVVFQFVISVGLVTGTWIVLDQLDFMQKQNLGFDKDEMIVVNAARANSAQSKWF
ncbi:MAG: hypothetical protein U5K54_05230 [Cytophagales bacterium]|nr:hypothetical protein [Cytophagales bacterium]